jgi:hypothetical protein
MCHITESGVPLQGADSLSLSLSLSLCLSVSDMADDPWLSSLAHKHRGHGITALTGKGRGNGASRARAEVADEESGSEEEDLYSPVNVRGQRHLNAELMALAGHTCNARAKTESSTPVTRGGKGKVKGGRQASALRAEPKSPPGTMAKLPYITK